MALVARTESDLKAVADELPGPSLVLSGDVTDADFNEAVADATVAEWGGVDVWICNAGISPIVAGPRQTDPAVWRQVLEVNLTGAFLGARAAARVMGDGGRMIFTGSVLGERPREGLTAYSASKAGLVGMAKGLALDLAPAGITVNVVAPGWFDSPLAERWKNSPELVGRHPRPHRATAVGSPHRSGRRVPVPGVRRLGVRHRHRAQRRRRIPAGMTCTPRRVVVITGAGGTLGAALSHAARRRARHRSGAERRQRAVARRDPGRPARDGGSVETVLADVSEFAQVEAVVALAVERFGRLDVLISNAGVLSPNGRIHNLTTEDWERAFRINLLGAVNGIRAAVAVMRAQRSGSIVLTASVVRPDGVVARRAVLRDEGGGDPTGEGRSGRVRPRRDPGELRVPGDVPLGDP